MKVVTVGCDKEGNIDINELREKVIKHKDQLAAMMITYPSTHGVFEHNIKDVCDLVHEYGGQIYMDGANLNAQIGYTSPAYIGADVGHLNLHKTFSIPHGGGGPGVGAIGAKEHLRKFLPGHSVQSVDYREGNAVAAAPYGSAGILPITFGFIKLMGRAGFLEQTRHAILNANYIADSLKDSYKVLYRG